MNTVNVRGLEIGTGRPKIAVPLTGAAREDLIAQANALPGLGADLAEWRMDCFAQVENGAAVAACLRDLRRSLGEMPLLATFRTDREGGAHPLSAQSYAALNETVLSSGQADLIDVELFSDGDCVPHLIAAAHKMCIRDRAYPARAGQRSPVPGQSRTGLSVPCPGSDSAAPFQHCRLGYGLWPPATRRFVPPFRSKRHSAGSAPPLRWTSRALSPPRPHRRGRRKTARRARRTSCAQTPRPHRPARRAGRG